jgi:hypothetical protein
MKVSPLPSDAGMNIMPLAHAVWHLLINTTGRNSDIRRQGWILSHLLDSPYPLTGMNIVQDGWPARDL